MGNRLNKRTAFVLAGFCVVALTGASCTPRSPEPVVIRVPVEVTRTVYVPISDGLTEPHPIAKPRNRSGREALRVARERKTELQRCNIDKASIRSVQGTETSVSAP